MPALAHTNTEFAVRDCHKGNKTKENPDTLINGPNI